MTSRGVPRGKGTHLGEKMAEGEYRADNFSRWRASPLENS